MRRTLLITSILMCSTALAQEHLTAQASYAESFAVGDSIGEVQASLGKPHRTYEVQNAYGGVQAYDYVWDQDGNEWTFVVTVDGKISSIWQADTI